MVTSEMVSKMKSGSVTVDLAAEAGGNIETTVKDQRIVTENGVICLGYTDLPSRLPTTSSSLYSNNASKWFLSAGPHTTKVKDHFYIDHSDEAVRGMLVLEKGEMMYPAPLPPPPPSPAKKTEEAKPIVIDYRAPYLQGAKKASIAAASILTMGCISPNPAFSNMFTTFALSNVIGVQVVLGVTHALHSPLMAVTNAISGTTALGGLHLFTHSTSPTATTLGALATTLSSVNIVGGFIVTTKMLDMFKRPTDPPEYYHLYGIPAAGALGMYGLAAASGKFPEIDAAAGTLAGLLCIGGIGGLGSQATARLGAVSGQAGVAMALASTLGTLSAGWGTTASMVGMMVAGGALGQYVGHRVEPTSLPQTVAAFHSLVGVAASATAIGEYMNTPDTTQLDSGKFILYIISNLPPLLSTNFKLITSLSFSSSCKHIPRHCHWFSNHHWVACCIWKTRWPVKFCRHAPSSKRQNQYGTWCPYNWSGCCCYGCSRAGNWSCCFRRGTCNIWSSWLAYDSQYWRS